ncbi:MAG: DUF4867 family protein [Spirochaetaceae bacterium]|jgi:hypothetical protein|nr:DUF4867 family protein [Spirochaetaceae bacterium]
MIIQNVYGTRFREYGAIIEGYDFTGLLDVLEQTDRPDNEVVYAASCERLEAAPVFMDMRQRLFGGLPVQAGYCNGRNTRLNCLEYHRGSEALIAGRDLVLLLAKKQDIDDFKIDTSKVEAFFVPRGAGVLCYETTLHYAPAKADGTFNSVIVLPRGTNAALPVIEAGNTEDKILFARNKWLLAHPESPEAKQGAFIGLTGKNIDISFIRPIR